MLSKPVLKYILLLGLAVILSATTVIFGATPMRAIRLAYGRVAHWAGFVLVSALVAAFLSVSYGVLVFALAVAVGVYAEVEEHGGAVFTSGFVALLAAIGTGAVGMGLWIHRTGAHVLEDLRAQVSPMVDRLTELNPNSAINVDTLIEQLPSGLMIGLVAALAISLIGERRILSWFGLPRPERASGRLLTFRVPDAFIWLTIAAVFGAFYRHGDAPIWNAIENVSVNALNVLVIVFFFQGLAIVAAAFRVYKVSHFWQGLWYVLLVLQLFLLVSMVGFADFWLDFRERLTRKPAEPKKIF